MALFNSAVDAVQAKNCLPAHLPPPPDAGGRLIILGAGKAAAAMAAVAEKHYRAVLGEGYKKKLSGLVITRYGHGVATRHIEVVEAAHPHPDEAGAAATRRLFEMAKAAGRGDLVLLLLSGGGSALLTMARRGVSLQLKRRVTAELMRKGAGIAELNLVRKHLSAIKGGKLAMAARPARMLTLAISDVAGDDPAVIASGPSVYDPASPGEAFAVLQKYEIAGREKLRFILDEQNSFRPEDFVHSQYRLIARPQDALQTAFAMAKKRGLHPVILGDALEGEARVLAREHARRALQTVPGHGGVVLLSGGEVTVRLEGEGEGGPNQEYVLALAIALGGAAGIYALACDTDGNDGGRGRADDPAGAIITPSTLVRARATGLDAGAALARNDSGGFFAVLGDLVQCGPTMTNVNDFRAILITH